MLQMQFCDRKHQEVMIWLPKNNFPASVGVSGRSRMWKLDRIWYPSFQTKHKWGVLMRRCSELLDVLTPWKKAPLLPSSRLVPDSMALLLTLGQLWCPAEPVQFIIPTKHQKVFFWASKKDCLSEEPASPVQCKERWEHNLSLAMRRAQLLIQHQP